MSPESGNCGDTLGGLARVWIGEDGGAWLPPGAASSLSAFDTLAAARGSDVERGDRLGDLLLRERVMTAGELTDALEEQRQTGRRLGEIVVAHGYATGPTLVKLLARQCRVELESENGYGSGLRRAIEVHHRLRRQRLFPDDEPIRT